MYTPKQVSDMLDIPTSSLRRYSQVFSDYLTIKHVKGQKRTYTEQDIVTLGKIRDLASSGLNHELIAERLPLIEDQKEPIDNALALIPTVAKELEAFKDFQVSIMQTVKTLEDDLNAEKNKTTELGEKITELENYISLPWWKKITKKTDIKK